MGYPLLPIVMAARGFVGAELMSARAFERVVEAIKHAPEQMSAGFLECPLSTLGERVDVLVATRASGEERSRFAVEFARHANLRREPTWGRLKTFVGNWNNPDSPTHCIPLVLLEFDCEGTLAREPGLHVCVDPVFVEHGWETPIGDPRTLSAQQLASLVGEVIASVTGSPPEPDLLSRLERCRATLPAGGRLLHLSIMLSRPGIPLKLNAVLPASGLLSWLESTGWPGDARDAAALMARYGFGQRLAKVDLALGAELGTRLGLEFAGPRWSDLLEILVEDSLCSQAQADALASWPGNDVIRLADMEWPVVLRRALEIKLVAEGSRREAKAYLAFSPHFSLFPHTFAARASQPPEPSS